MKKIMFLFVLTAWTYASMAQNSYSMTHEDSVLDQRLTAIQNLLKRTPYAKQFGRLILGRKTPTTMVVLSRDGVRPDSTDFVLYMQRIPILADTTVTSRYKNEFTFDTNLLLSAREDIAASVVVAMITYVQKMSVLMPEAMLNLECYANASGFLNGFWDGRRMPKEVVDFVTVLYKRFTSPETEIIRSGIFN